MVGISTKADLGMDRGTRRIHINYRRNSDTHDLIRHKGNLPNSEPGCFKSFNHVFLMSPVMVCAETTTVYTPYIVSTAPIRPENN